MENHYMHTGIRMPRILLPRHAGNHHEDRWYGAGMATRRILKRMTLILLLLWSAAGVLQAQINISGTVTDAEDEPLIGVNIQVKGTTTGTATDFDGRFALEEVAEDAVLTVSYVGYQTQEVAVAGQTEMVITLLSDAQLLDEVVVVGYGVERKRDLIGSVSVINTDELTSTPASDVTNQLQGRAPGVTVSTTGDIDGSAKVRIRGFGSFTGSDPLYIIDGVPVSSGIGSLNPNDIESMQILKDASSASIYGARAANGVIIITTKKGKAGPVKVSANAYYGINYTDRSSLPDFLNAHEYGQLYWAQMRGAGLQPGDPGWGHLQYGDGPEPVIPEYILVKNQGEAFGGAALERLRNTDPTLFQSLVNSENYDFATHQIVKSGDTYWPGEAFVNAPQQSYQLSFSGGSENSTYMLSLNHFSRQGTLSDTHYYKRSSIRSNVSFRITDRIRVGSNLMVNFTRSNTSISGVASAWNISPLIPLYDIMGNPASTFAPGTSGTEARNPVTEAWRNRFDKNESHVAFGNGYAEFDILKNLVAHSSFGFDYWERGLRDFTPITFEHAENVNVNNLSISQNNALSWTWTNTLTYKKSIADRHNFSLMAGTEAINNQRNSLSASRNEYPLNEQDNPNFHVLNAGLSSQTNSGSFSRNSLFSLFSRIEYTYADRYLFNATIRRDQSSKFAENNRTGYFPAASVGWRLSSESFMEELRWIDDLKVRASWGIIGNQTGLDNENQYDVFVSNISQSYPIAGGNASKTDSYTMSRIGNPNASWEKNITTNLGLDGSFFRNSIDLTLDLYKKIVRDLLVQNQPPYTGPSGNSSPTQPYINTGEMENRGIDIGITKREQIGELELQTGLIFSTYTNKVTKILDNPLSSLIGGSTRIGNVTRTEVGMPVSMFYGYVIDGFFNTEEEAERYRETHTTWLEPEVGRWRIKDLNGDNVIDASDRTFIGNPHPDFQISLNLSLKYRNFDFAAFFFWNQGGDIFNYSRYVSDFNTFNQNRSERMLYESWTPELGDKAKLPKLDILDTYSNQNIIDYFVEDGTYYRLRNVQLGYSIPKNILDRVGVGKIRFYVQAQNFFTITKFSGMDPDYNLQGNDLSMGISHRPTPTPKQILFGIDFSL